MATQNLAEALVESCRSGDVQSLQALLTQYPGIDVNFTTEGGVTLLMHTIIGAGESKSLLKTEKKEECGEQRLFF